MLIGIIQVYPVDPGLWRHLNAQNPRLQVYEEVRLWGQQRKWRHNVSPKISSNDFFQLKVVESFRLKYLSFGPNKYQ